MASTFQRSLAWILHSTNPSVPRVRSFLLVLATLTIANVHCTDTDGVQGPGSASQLQVRAASGVWVNAAEERAILGRAARLVAKSLGRAEVRGLVFSTMRDSPFRENKVHFRSFLAGSGRQLLAAMAVEKGTGATQSDVLASLDSAIDLEFYMPVRTHWARWQGEPVIVATALRDHELPIAYDQQGNSVTIESADIPPTTLAVALVPVETNFSRIPLTNVSEHPGASAQVLTCPPSACLTYSYIPSDWEGWMMGQPEVETHVFVRPAGSSSAQHYVCAGGDSQAHYYDQNNAYWNGAVELASSAAMEILRDQGTNLLVQVWEDDTEPCTIRKDPQWLAGVWATVRTLFGEFAAVAIAVEGWDDVCGSDNESEHICWVALLQALFAPFDIFSAFNEDDYVGELVPTSVAGNCYNGNHVIVGGNGASMGCVYVSGITMVAPTGLPTPPLAASISGPTSIVSKGSYTWTAVRSGGPAHTLTNGRSPTSRPERLTCWARPRLRALWCTRATASSK